MSWGDPPRSGVLRGRWDVIGAVAAGGAMGSLGRWGVSVAMPPRPGGFPWATFTVNVVGCLTIGALMVVLLEVVPPSRYLRPFLATGLLGGFTTFSAYTLEIRTLAAGGAPGTALVYLAGSLLLGFTAVWLGAVLARLAISLRHPRDHTEPPPGSQP